jgi:serine/threonine protein kinase
MAAPTTVSDLMELVRQSLPHDPLRLDSYVAGLRRAAALPGAPGGLAALLVRDGFLTPFQAEHLLRGRRPKFVIGKYLILDRLGAGGMGAVYLCEHLHMGRLVALKVLPADQAQDPAALARFHREAQAVAALDHPNIVRAYDVDAEGRTAFLVMEYVDGIDLQELVSRRGPLDPARAAGYVRQAADGLQHAHESRLVHRDVKPANLLLSRSGVVKVLDLGLARFFHEDAASVTEHHGDEAVLATADYVSPEQARGGGDVDVRADIYSLGATFYFLLAGRAPFADGSAPQKLLWHQLKEPPPLRRLRPEVPEAMAAVVARMMMKHPPRRCQTPAEVAAALAPWTQAAPPPPPEEMPPVRPTITAGRPWRKNLPAAAPTVVQRASRPTVVAGPSATPPPAAPRVAPVVVAARTPPPPTREDDWSVVFDDDPTGPEQAAPAAPRREERHFDFSPRNRRLYLAVGAAALLLTAAGVALAIRAAMPRPPAPTPAPAPTPPAPAPGPTHLRAAVKTPGAVELTWDDPHGPAAGCRLERSTDRYFLANLVVMKVDGDVRNYTDAKAAPGQVYYYRVRAVRDSGESGVSNTAWPPPPYADGFTPAGLALNGGAAVVDKVLRLTDANGNEARSAFFREPVDVRAFRTAFRFRIAAGPQTADGFTFCIHGGDPTRVGAPGAGLGYQGIPKSVAVKFDLFNNDGEGPNSTGLFLNGAMPSNPGAVDLTPSGIDLHTGNAYDAVIDYKDGKLTLTITDVGDAAKRFTKTFPVDVPATVGGPTAIVGFTGGTGGAGAVQDILSWTWESTAGGD